jgi:hypothetical protein
MYCSTCECEFEGWIGKCPNCKNPLLEEVPPFLKSNDETASYESLVEILRENGGAFDIDLVTIEVAKSKSTLFPWLGYGYAWAKRMRGARKGITADFTVSEIAKVRRYAFPYQGHGYAWRKELQGSIAGNEAILKAKKVTRKRSWGFPYFGYGYAWTEQMAGKCGEDVVIELNTTEVGKNRSWLFPYFGFGYAWVKQGILSLTWVP